MEKTKFEGSVLPPYDDATAGFTSDWLDCQIHQPNQQMDLQPSLRAPAVHYVTAGGQIEIPTGASITTVIITSPQNFGPYSQFLVCPACGQRVKTRVESEANFITHTYACLLCIFGGILCCWIPYVMDLCINRNYYCPNCDNYLGTYTQQQ